jgi:hypothetical protein
MARLGHSQAQRLLRLPGPFILAAMTLKSASFLAMIGTLLVTTLVSVNFFNTIVGVLHDIVPAMALLPCLVYFLAGIAVTAFFWVYNRSQS